MSVYKYQKNQCFAVALICENFLKMMLFWRLQQLEQLKFGHYWDMKIEIVSLYMNMKVNKFDV